MPNWLEGHFQRYIIHILLSRGTLLLKALITCLKVIILCICKVLYALQNDFACIISFGLERGSLLIKLSRWSEESECSAITNIPSNQGEYVSGWDLSIIKEGKKSTFPVILESELLGIGLLPLSCTLHNLFFSGHLLSEQNSDNYLFW